MEGALTDIIENNALDEDQISGICLEVSILFYFIFLVDYVLTFFLRRIRTGSSTQPKHHPSRYQV